MRTVQIADVVAHNCTGTGIPRRTSRLGPRPHTGELTFAPMWRPAGQERHDFDWSCRLPVVQLQNVLQRNHGTDILDLTALHVPQVLLQPRAGARHPPVTVLAVVQQQVQDQPVVPAAHRQVRPDSLHCQITAIQLLS